MSYIRDVLLTLLPIVHVQMLRAQDVAAEKLEVCSGLEGTCISSQSSSRRSSSGCTMPFNVCHAYRLSEQPFPLVILDDYPLTIYLGKLTEDDCDR